MNGPVIRPASADDLAELHSLVERAYRGDAARQGWTHEADYIEGPRTDLATLAAAVADPHQAILLAHDGTVLQGCVQVTDYGDGRAGMSMLCVDPALQAGGLGRVLMAAAEIEAARRGARSIDMTVVGIRAELIAYYERRGYMRTGERRPFDYPGVIGGAVLDFVVLDKRL